MIVGCSHTGCTTAMEASAAPCIFSHANARALRDRERTIRDEQAAACAATGGVVGVAGIGNLSGRKRYEHEGAGRPCRSLREHRSGRSMSGSGSTGPSTTPTRDGAGLAGMTARNPEYRPRNRYDYPSIGCAPPAPASRAGRGAGPAALRRKRGRWRHGRKLPAAGRGGVAMTAASSPAHPPAHPPASWRRPSRRS